MANANHDEKGRFADAGKLREAIKASVVEVKKHGGFSKRARKALRESRKNPAGNYVKTVREGEMAKFGDKNPYPAGSDNHDDWQWGYDGVHAHGDK